jgi:hypothetical protein
MALLLDFFSGRPKLHPPHSGREAFIAVQDRDPYVESLLLALRGLK